DASPEIVAEVVKNYQGVLDKASWVGSNKAKFVNDLEEPVWESYSNGSLNINTEGALFEDSITSLDKILTSGERVDVLTTGNSQWILRAIGDVDKALVKYMNVYFGNKELGETFEQTDKYIKKSGGIWISHTEDQLKGFNGLIKTDLPIQKVYVDRNPGKEDTTGLVNIYTTDLNKVDYTRIKNKGE
ncbi:hypothetical protein N9934_01780, partial [Desulfosarcina sp.]|nr:hypothetical protein [Desulfosarcina sp.]